ncbi:hypothetical protein RSK20926_07137 [Roseobacter sp. SK209-2-6]|nr:hypothetical protein RSK20926_07137 [Roseobacter sp. SK209-2-6]
MFFFESLSYGLILVGHVLDIFLSADLLQ